MSIIVRHRSRARRVACDCGLELRFSGEERFVECHRCERLHMRGTDQEAGLPARDAESDPSVRFVMLAGSAVTVTGGPFGMFAMRREFYFGCTVPNCEWKGGEDHLRAHFEFHSMLAPQPLSEATRIPLG